MTYVTGDIPVGFCDSTRLANLGMGHAAIDGGGYTYFSPASGHEFSATGTGLRQHLGNIAVKFRILNSGLLMDKA